VQKSGGADIGASLSGMFAALGALAFLGAVIVALATEFDYQLDLIDSEGAVVEASIAGTVAAVIVVFVAFLFGGWVAGRMTRGDGGMSGLGAGLWLLVLGAIFALLGALVAPELNAFAAAELPDWFSALTEENRTTAGIVALVVFAAAVLFGGYVGGRLGESNDHRHTTVQVADARY
jgi:hypothetical protein